MKKFTRTGKKVLSVFLAALMVMTAWVFVAPEAKAQSAGSYYVTITFNVDNHDNESFAAYTGKSQNGNNTVGISLFYKANNGTASSASEKVFDLGSYVGNNAAQTSHTLTCTVAGFPSEVYGYVNDDNMADKTAIRITKVQCGSSSSNLKTIWSGNARIESVKNPYYCTLTPTSSTANANDSATYVKNVDASGWKTPAPTTITWSPATLSAMTCPKTGTATQTVKVTAKDQYGVNMYDPTWSVSGSNKSTGLSMSTGNNRAESSNIQVTNSANLAGTTDSQTGTVTVTWGSGQTDKKTFTINDTTYTATFAGLKNTDGTDKDNVTANYKHGHTPTAATTASEYDIGDYHFKFSGWSPSIGEITADTTYTAQYDSNFVAADLTELNNQISNADYVKTTELWTTGSYTDESMAALESALTAAKNTRDSNPGRTQQSTVDSVAKTLKDAIDALKLKTYTVKFYNAEGLIIKTEEVVAGKAATAPASPAKNDDETYHYSFKAWDKAFNNVTSDLDVRPTYTPEAHKWQTSTTVPANCQHGAGIKKTCSVCSRVSESYDDTLGAHTKSTHYAVSKEATCTADGTGYYYCTVCGTNMGNVTIKAKGHTYDTGKVTKEASCTATGTRLHTCTSCGDTYTETLEKIPHTYAKSSTVVATCEHSAYDVMKCSVCGDTYNKYVGGIAEHNWEWTVKNATLSENGSVTGTCKNCGYTVTKEVPFDGHHYDFDNPIITEATCNADGSVVINCTDSGCTEKIAIKLNKTDIHNYTTKYTAPNCTTAGSIVNTCSVCKTSTTVETIAALGHNYGEAVVTPATCTEDGKMTYTCARCNDVKTTTIKATGHKEYVIDAIEATCNTEGRTEGKKCAVCGETIVASTVIAKKAHSFTGEVKTIAATCEADGATLTKCANCDTWKIDTIPAIGHNYKEEVVAPTCTSKGYTKHTCQNCGKVYTDNETAMISHNYVLNSDLSLAPSCEGEGVNIYVCSVCGSSKSEKVKEKGHSFSEWSEYTAATCTGEGSETRSCSVCGKTEVRKVAKLGHDYSSDFTTDIAATCISAGQKSKHCSRCDAKTEVTTIQALGHNLSTTTTTATCTVGSKKIDKCSRCDYEKTTIISEALGHNFVAGTPVEATCASSGYIPYTCSRNCGVAGYNVINGGASKNHNWKITSTVSHGTTTVTGSCSVCGATFSETVNSAHDFKTIESQTPATCIESGSLTLACADENCNETFTVTLEKNKNAHKSVTNTLTKASCTEAGKVVSICDDCRKVLATTEIPATGHSFTEQTEYVASTCTTQGHITFKCANCTQTKTVTLDVNSNAHKFGSSVHYNATCTTPAYDKYTCENGCGESYEKITGTVAAHAWTFSTSQSGTTLTITCKCSKCDAQHTQTVEVAEGHNYNSVTVTKQPTCSAEGEMKIACDKNHKADCTASITVALPVNENAHSVKTVVTPATCTTAGTAYSYCELCNKTIGDTVEIAALGHNYVGGEEKVKTAATCEKDGVKTVKCTRCDDTIEIAIAKLGHTWDNGTSHDADCTHSAYTTYKCSTCGETKDVVSAGAKANGHDWGDWEVTKKSTNTEKGLLTRVCKTDETHVETVETPAGGHTFDMNNPSEEEKATCSAEGWKLFKCTAHTGDEACGIELKVTTEKVQHEFKIVTIPASCTESGSVKISCKNCDEAFDEITLNPLGHDFSKETANVASTCNTVGYVTKQCSRCEETETTYSSTLADHSWGDLKVVQTADETHPGIKVKQCSVCNLYDYEYTLPTGDHHWNEGVITTPATCTTDGEKTYTCLADVNCACKADNKATYTEKIPAKGHKAKVELKEATCSEAGYVKAVCETCGTTLDEKTLEKKEHIYQSEVTTEPTCQTPGVRTFTCALCGDTYTEQIETVSHNYQPTDEYVDATCTSPKYQKYRCTYCSEEKLVKVKDANGHDTTENYVEVEPATCTKAGYSEWRCHCGALLGTKVLGPSDHTWEEVTVDLGKECDGAKVTYEKCSVCGVIKANSLEINEAGDHEYVVTTEIAATCTTAGKLVITCKNCKNVRAEVEIPAVGHTYDEGVLTEGTCETDGNVTFTCTREGCTDAQTGHTITKNIGKKNHNYLESGAPVAATCTSSGYQLYKCEYCNKEFKQILEAPVAAHIYEKQPTSTEPNCYQDGHYYFKCKNCDAAYDYVVSATGRHEFKSEVTQAQSCTNPESTTYTCTTVGCGYSYIKVTKSALGHSFGEWEVTKEPTETEDGEQKRSCTRDGCDEPETAPIPASIHNWGETPIATTDATCTEAATETYRCTGCDLCNAESGYKTYVKTVGDPLGHEVVVDYHAPTCKEDGSYRAYCKRCPVEFTEETIPATGHSFNTYLQDTYVAATCQSEGSMTFACSNGCRENTTVTIPVNPDAHHMVVDNDNSKDATCTEAGYVAYKCDNEGCDHTYMTQIENPTSHTAKDEWTVKQEATCHSDGYAVLECKDCGAVMETKVLPADETLHTWKTISEKADHTKSGYSYEQCEACGKTRNFETEPLVKHDYSTLVSEKAATAEEDGYVTYECSCGDRITLVVPRTGHSFVSSVTKEATCTEKGVRTFTCKLHENCTANYSEEIPALGHKAADVVLTPVTCIAEGAAVVNCETCGDELSRVAIAKLPHTYEQTSRVEPTCHTTGSITYSCTTEGCTASYSISLNMVPHKYEYKESVAPTCLSSGYDVYVCAFDGCNDSYNKITDSANGHRYELVKEEAPTCSENGHRYYECKNCTGDEKAKYDYEVPATGNHNYSETVTADPTCETAGYSYKKCKDCDAVDKNSVKAIDPLGHDYSIDLGNGTFKCLRCDKTIIAQKTITDEDGTVHSFIGTVTKQSTCKEHGEIAYTCQNHKNCERNFTEELPLSEHAANAESIVKTEPKCNIDGTLENGSVKIVCAVCGETITELELTASHSYKVTKVEKATCASNGKVTEVCEKCGHEKTTEIAMDPVAHDFKNEPDLVVAATCTTDGYAVYSCRHCDAQKYVKTTDKLDHRNTTITTVQPSCEVDGYERVTCDDCGKIISETAIEKTGHKAVKVTVAATCTKGGSITTKCSVCGEILDVVLTEAKGHTWGAWVRTEEGSCLAEGSEYRECSVCHVREERQSGIGEHHYDIIEVVEPTCESDGYTKYTCSVCGHFYIADYVPHTGHTYTSDFKVVVEPTCHSTGAKARTCKYCGQIDPDDAHYVEIQELPHNYGEWVFTTDPTCENNGVKVRTCQNEGCTDKDEGHTETVVVGKLGHHYGDWTVVRDATCVMNGEKQRVCDRCGGIDTAEIAKVGHKRVADPEVPATCTKTGLTGGSHCSVCGTIFVAQKEIPMTDHMDLSGDGRCDGCGKTLEGKNGNDTCWCHRTGIAALVYGFVRIFWKIFKINQYCVCGDKHY